MKRRLPAGTLVIGTCQFVGDLPEVKHNIITSRMHALLRGSAVAWNVSTCFS